MNSLEALLAQCMVITLIEQHKIKSGFCSVAQHVTDDVRVQRGHTAYLITSTQSAEAGMGSGGNAPRDNRCQQLAMLYFQVYVCVIRELVDSLCSDGANAQYMQYLSKSCRTSPQILAFQGKLQSLIHIQQYHHFQLTIAKYICTSTGR